MLKEYPELQGVASVVIAALISAFWSFSKRRDVFDPRVFFAILFAYVTVSPCLYCILFDEPYHPGLKQSLLLPVLYSSSSAIGGFFVGASLAIGGQTLSLSQLRARRPVNCRSQDLNAVRLTRALSILAATVALVLYAYFTREVLASQPSGIGGSKSVVLQYVSEQTLGLLHWTSSLSSVSLILYVISDSVVSRRTLSLATLVLLPTYALLCVLGGEREFLLVGLVWFTSNWRKLSRRVVFLIAFSFVVMLGAVPILRTQGLGGKSMLDTLYQVEWSQMAGSLMNLCPNLVVSTNVASIVPRQEPFWYGETLLRSALSFFPMMPEWVDQSPARWFAEVYDHQGQAGLAFTQHAEAYMNFGWFGVPFWFAGWGYLLGALYHRAARPDAHFINTFIWWQAAVVGLFSCRTDSRLPMKLLVFGAIGVYLIHYFSVSLSPTTGRIPQPALPRVPPVPRNHLAMARSRVPVPERNTAGPPPNGARQFVPRGPRPGRQT